MRFIFLAIGIVLLSFSVSAQQEKDSIVAKKLNEVEVSAHLRPAPSQSSTPLQVLTEEDILKQGISSIGDAVKRFNGVVLKDYGGIGGLKTVSIRGMGAEYTAVSYDGMMVNNLQSGQVDIGRFTLDNVSILSLSIGQADDIFQSAKTLTSAGILNLQTKKPTFDKSNHRVHSKISTGSFGYFEPMISYAYQVNPKLALSSNINWQRADGQYPYVSQSDGKLKRINSDIDILRTEVNLYSQLSQTDLLDVKLYYFDSERGLPGAHTPYNQKINTYERLWDKNTFAQVTYNKQISNKWKFKSLAKYDYRYSKYENRYIELSRNKYREHEVYSSNVLMYNITSKLSASVSQDFIYSSLRSRFTIGDSDHSSDKTKKEPDRYNSFSSLTAQYKSDRLTMTASGLFSFVKETLKHDKGKNYYRKFSPALSASYKPFDTNLRFRASYKHIYRVPTFNELYYSPAGKQLKAESSAQYNVGTTWVTAINNAPIDYINLSVDAYYNDIKDKIIINAQPSFPVSYNLGKVEMKGVDVKLSSNIKVSNQVNFDILGVYSYLQARDMSKEDYVGISNAAYKHQIVYTPKHSGSASLTLNNPWVNLSYAVIFSGARYYERENLKKNKIDSYTDHSITLFKEMMLKETNLYISGTINNLWNKNYDVVIFYPMPTRAFRITAGIKF